MRTRRNVYSITGNDETLKWYNTAVGAMKLRAPDDPRSWEYQARIHSLIGSVPQAQAEFWRQCQHSNSFFLPWHRMYLLRFERIVAAEVAAAGGPADWALPYWNYSEPGQRRLPEAFRGATLADGSVNHLHVPLRDSRANAGQDFMDDEDVNLRCLNSPGTTGFDGFFGDARPAHRGILPGTLEMAPHNNVHGAVGGFGGWMSDARTAALDPIFWLHHANIDRLWEVWLARDASHQNLVSTFWRRGVTFKFHDETGAVVSMKTEDVLNLAATGVEYEYDDIGDPFGAGPGPAGFAAAAAPTPEPAMANNPQMELAGATLAPIQLDSRVSHVQVPTPVKPEDFVADAAAALAAAPAGVAAPAPTEVKKVALVLENMTSSDITPTYDVYVNVPDADTPGQRKDRFVGRAALFGIDLASDPAGDHGGSGQTVAFDITGLYKQLAGTRELKPDSLKVSFVPVHPEHNPRVSVGRVGIYFA